MAYMTREQVIINLAPCGCCAPGIQWAEDNNLTDLKLIFDNCQRADWIIFTLILLEYDMDDTIQLVADAMPPSDDVTNYMALIPDEGNLGHKADLAANLFKDLGEAYCDIVRANIVIEEI